MNAVEGQCEVRDVQEEAGSRLLEYRKVRDVVEGAPQRRDDEEDTHRDDLREVHH